VASTRLLRFARKSTPRASTYRCPRLGTADDRRRIPAEDRLAAAADADYGDFVDIPREQVANTLETARRFVAAMETAVQGHAR